MSTTTDENCTPEEPRKSALTYTEDGTIECADEALRNLIEALLVRGYRPCWDRAGDTRGTFKRTLDAEKIELAERFAHQQRDRDALISELADEL